MYHEHNPFAYKGCGIKMPGKYCGRLTIRENVVVRLQESKGCGSWSDAIESLLDTIDEQKNYIIELREKLKSNVESENQNIPE